MHPLDYFFSLSEARKQAYAERVGTSLAYMRINIFRKKGFRKTPSDDLLIRLANASEGHVSLDEAIDYFLVQPVKNLAKDMETKEQAPRVLVVPTISTNVQQMELAGT